MEEQTIIPESLLDKAKELGLSFSYSLLPLEIFPAKIEKIIAEVHSVKASN